MQRLENVSIILAGTYHPGNIGAAARSMMNFGLKKMILAAPNCGFTDETYLRARSAARIFENARIVESLDEISGDFEVLVGTSRRGAYRLHLRMSPAASANEIASNYSHVRTGILFGNEKWGLSNEDLEKCAWYITIPTHPDFESLNLAHSVTVVAYELYQAFIESREDVYKKPASHEQMNQVVKHMGQFLKALGFPTRGSADRVYSDVKRVLASADLKKTDATLMHGFMRFIENKYLGGWLEDEE